MVWTDHKNLYIQYICTAKCLNARQARWSLVFSRFNVTLDYRPRSKNSKLNALSRIYPVLGNLEVLKHSSILPDNCFVRAIQLDIKTLVRSAQPDNAAPSQCPPFRPQVSSLPGP